MLHLYLMAMLILSTKVPASSTSQTQDLNRSMFQSLKFLNWKSFALVSCRNERRENTAAAAAAATAAAEEEEERIKQASLNQIQVKLFLQDDHWSPSAESHGGREDCHVHL